MDIYLNKLKPTVGQLFQTIRKMISINKQF